MFGIDDLRITLTFSPWLFVLAVLLFVGFTIFIYRFTVPQISKAKKTLLIIARVLSLGLLLLSIFEPTLTIIKKNILKPVTYFFVDNSKSMLSKDGIKKDEQTLSILEQFSKSELTADTRLNLFGNEIRDFSADSLENLSFKDGSTNFSDIFNSISEKKENISSIVILSDGVITDGSNPINAIDKIGIPVFTIGVGDTTKRKDIEIKNVLYNEFLYAETPTTLSAAIFNEGFANRNVSVSLQENDKVIEQKSILLSPDGIQNVQLNYTPITSGEKKLSVVISSIEEEFNKANNRKVFYINVLSSKVKVLLLAGSPSPDLSFIKQTLSTDANLSVNSITQIGANKYLEKNNREKLLDSSEILFLIGFPSKETSSEMLNRVSVLISSKNIPYLFVLSSSVEFNKLTQLKKDLPFSFTSTASNYLEVQPSISSDEFKNPLLQNKSSDPISAWNSLPPVFQPFSEFTAKPESEAIAKAKMNNIATNKPLIITRRLGSQRSIAVLAKDVWRWKLQTALKEQDVFDRFILNSIKWLNSPEDKKRVQIRTTKKLFSLGEEVEFTAQIYDDTFSPVAEAEVKIRIKNGEDKFELNLNPVGNGLYEGKLQTNKPGNYSFVGDAKLNNKMLGIDAGLFNMGDVDIEMTNTRMDFEFLNSLANLSGGEYFNPSEVNQLLPLLLELNKKSSKEKVDTKEFSLWSNEFLMLAIILLFGIEWFVRKRVGML